MSELIDTDSEEYRHRCEVWQVLRWRALDRNKSSEYLQLVRKMRGGNAADKLEKDCKEQWERGNRGLKGDWRDK